MKRLSTLLVAAILLGTCAWQLYGDSPAEAAPQEATRQDPLKSFMQKKLSHSKGILEAIAMENFDMMAKDAQALSLLSLESNWNTITTQEYIEQSSDFRRACQVIKEAAEEKNVDRAALGFVNLTVRCVECHKYLRKNALLPKRAE